MKKMHFLAASSLLAISAVASAAWAQGGDSVEQVEVSASRISVAGYTAPTPVTVVGAEDLERSAKTDIGDTIRELPSVGNSSSATNGSAASNFTAGTSGLDTVNLRNLGTNRTLVLFDGQRVVQSNITGITDLATIPTTLVKRVDVVTGGASAAWGSDAVAGVVNIVIDKSFTGFKGNIQGGTNYNYQLNNYKYEGSVGTDFDGGRGHLIFSASYMASPDILFNRQADWYRQIALINNPAYKAGNGQPQLIHATVGSSQATTGGLILSGTTTAGATSTALKGIQFTGPNGTPAPFNFGNVTASVSDSPDAQTTYADSQGLTVNNHNTTVFAYASYKLTPAINASLQLNYGKGFSANSTIPNARLGNQTILADNAYLDPTIAARMQTLGLKSLTIGTLGTNGFDFKNPTLKGEAATLGIPVDNQQRQLMRAVLSLDGTIGADWVWNAYYQHGQTRIDVHVYNNVNKANYSSAVDAVRVTAANAGTSGLPIGTIACRSTLTNPTNGCSPLNVFGDVVPSASAMKYIGVYTDYEHIVLNQDVVAGSMQGVLPWELPAGKVAVAFGAEYRKEGGRITTDPLAAVQAYQLGNFAPFAGQYHVEEGFLEVDAPLLKNQLVQTLDLNMAGRMTSYSTSGLVETYKLGLTSQVTDDIRTRFTYSVDIRAPTLSDLFSTGLYTSGSITLPGVATPQQGYTVSTGNPDLKPEVATTLSGGIVYTPAWLEGLSLSADWYSILIHAAIYSANATQTLQQCLAGNQLYCNQFRPGTGNGDAYVFLSGLNAAAETTSGLDFQADYVTPLFDGDLLLHAVGNYTDEQTRRALGVLDDSANCLSSACDNAFTGVPKFRSTLAATYSEGPYSVTMQARLIGSAHLNNMWTSGVQVDNNDVPFFAYVDLRGSYKYTDRISIYGAIDNVANTDPPVIPVNANTSASAALYAAPVRGDIYSTNGRAYRLGVRFSY